MDKCCLFCFQTDEMNEELNTVRRSLTRAGWQLKNITDLSMLALNAFQQKQVVCVFWFDETNINNTDFFESISSLYHFEWIALTKQSYLNNVEHRHLLASDFFDYHTYPYDINRLIFSLGHALDGKLKAKPT